MVLLEVVQEEVFEEVHVVMLVAEMAVVLEAEEDLEAVEDSAVV